MLDILLKSLGLNPADPSIRNAIQQIFCELPRLLEQMQHTSQDVVRLRRAIESQYGRGSLDALPDERMRPRRLEDMPFFATGTSSERVVINLEEQLSRWPSAGWVANIGNDECQVVLVYPHNQRTAPMPLMPGTTEALTGYLVGVEFLPVANRAFRFKLKAY